MKWKKKKFTFSTFAHFVLSNSKVTLFIWSNISRSQRQPLKSNNLYFKSRWEAMASFKCARTQTQIKLLIPLGPLTVAYGNKPTQQKDNMWSDAHSSSHTKARTQISDAQLKPDEDNILLQTFLEVWNKWGWTDRDSGWEPCCLNSKLHQSDWISSATWRQRRRKVRHSRPEEVEWTYKYNSNTHNTKLFSWTPSRQSKWKHTQGGLHARGTLLLR